MKKVVIGLSIVLVGVVGFFLFQGSQTKADSGGKAVELYKVEKQKPLHLKGQVQSLRKQSVFVDPEHGKIQTIHYNEGDHVSKDDVLVTYEKGEKVKAADDSIVSTMDVDAKNDSTKPLMILKSKEAEIKGTVTEYDRSTIALNEPVDIQVVNNDKVVKGKITRVAEISKEAESNVPSSESSVVTYDYSAIPDAPISNGSSVEILIPRNELNLPSKSVLNKDGKQYVYTKKGKKAEKRAITAEKQRGYFVLREGLDVGDKIISNAKGIKDGMEVKTK